MPSEKRTDTHAEWTNVDGGLAFSGRVNTRDVRDLMETLDLRERWVVNTYINSEADLIQLLEIVFRRRAERALAKAKP